MGWGDSMIFLFLFGQGLRGGGAGGALGSEKRVRPPVEPMGRFEGAGEERCWAG